MAQGWDVVLLRLTRGPINWTRRTVAHLLRKATRPLMRAAPSLVAPLRSWGWLWQPTYDPKWLERFYRRHSDPYGLSRKPYAAKIYAHKINLLTGRMYDRGLEVGCAEGVFTEMLAPLCHSLVAIDASATAVMRARQKLRDLPQVTVSRLVLPMEMPSGEFDLIVCSDVLYYFPRDVLVQMMPRLKMALASGGTLLALHYLGRFGQSTRGQKVHELLCAYSGLKIIHDETVPNVGHMSAGYRVTLLRNDSEDCSSLLRAGEVSNTSRDAVAQRTLEAHGVRHLRHSPDK